MVRKLVRKFPGVVIDKLVAKRKKRFTMEDLI